MGRFWALDPLAFSVLVSYCPMKLRDGSSHIEQHASSISFNSSVGVEHLRAAMAWGGSGGEAGAVAKQRRREMRCFLAHAAKGVCEGNISDAEAWRDEANKLKEALVASKDRGVRRRYILRDIYSQGRAADNSSRSPYASRTLVRDYSASVLAQQIHSLSCIQ